LIPIEFEHGLQTQDHVQQQIQAFGGSIQLNLTYRGLIARRLRQESN
jgi:hypothetical protein